MTATGWHPGLTAPVRVDVYERQGGLAPMYAFWDGLQWCGERFSPAAARDAAGSRAVQQCVPWRDIGPRPWEVKAILDKGLKPIPFPERCGVHGSSVCADGCHGPSQHVGGVCTATHPDEGAPA